MTSLSLFHPLRSIQRRHLVLLRQVSAIQHRLLDQSTWLGYLWSFLQPLLLLLVLWAVFSRRVGGDVPNYAVYLLIGLVQFTHFAKSTGDAMRVLHRMRSLATNAIFPKEVLIYSALLSNLPEYLISITLTAAIALISGAAASWAIVALPLVLAAQLLLVTWISLLLAIGYVFVRDIDHLFEVAMRLLFFVTPIIYSLDLLSPRLQRLALLNPLAHVLGYTRGILLEGRTPPVGALATFIAVNVLLVYGAVVLFRRSEPAVLERL
jgi:ABC-2 type transport system permease protein